MIRLADVLGLRASGDGAVGLNAAGQVVVQRILLEERVKVRVVHEADWLPRLGVDAEGGGRLLRARELVEAGRVRRRFSTRRRRVVDNIRRDRSGLEVAKLLLQLLDMRWGTSGGGTTNGHLVFTTGYYSTGLQSLLIHPGFGVVNGTAGRIAHPPKASIN